MQRLAVKDARQEFSKMLDRAQREPVTIEKKGRPVAVVISIDEYKRLEALEDAAWGAWATRAENEGFIGTDTSEDLLKELLNVEG